jgi:ADP-heptose:LPS heptosyltransferase
LGDCILFARMLEQLSPGARFVGPGEVGRLLKGLGVVADALDFEVLPMQALFAETDICDSALPALLGTCDRLISCFPQRDLRAQQRMAMACGARDSVFLPVRPPQKYAKHLLNLWALRLGETWDAEAISSRAWAVPQAWRSSARALLRSVGVDGEYVLLHPGAGGVDKCLPLDWYVALAAELQADIEPVLLIGPAEEERFGTVTIAEKAAPLRRLISPSLADLAGLLAEARCFVGHDTGPSHLAAAVGTRIVSLFVSTQPENFRPLGPDVEVLQTGADRMLRADAVAAAVHGMTG